MKTMGFVLTVTVFTFRYPNICTSRTSSAGFLVFSEVLVHGTTAKSKTTCQTLQKGWYLKQLACTLIFKEMLIICIAACLPLKNMCTHLSVCHKQNEEEELTDQALLKKISTCHDLQLDYNHTLDNPSAQMPTRIWGRAENGMWWRLNVVGDFMVSCGRCPSTQSFKITGHWASPLSYDDNFKWQHVRCSHLKIRRLLGWIWL